jgi:hypothetical protein
MSYEVSKAEYNDLEWIVDCAVVKMLQDEVKNMQYYNKTSITDLVMNALLSGTLLICKKEDERVGVLGGVLVPHYLNTDKKILAEIIWYVSKEHRTGRAGYLLLKEYSKMAREISDMATFSLLADSPVSDKTLMKFGFKPTERSFLMEN